MQTLGRLTEGDGRLDAMSAAELKNARFKATADRMMTLTDLLDLVAGRVALILELKSRFDRDSRLRGAPPKWSAPMRDRSPRCRSIPGRSRRSRISPPGCRAASWRRAIAAAIMPDHDPVATSSPISGSGIRSRPHFLAYHVNDLPASRPLLGRYVLGMPLLTWTVRTPDDRRRAARWADQIIFEGFRP